MSEQGRRWLDREAGPVVRPYAVTKGRTVPSSGAYIGLIDVIAAVPEPRYPLDAHVGREHRRILNLCRQPVAVVDLASDVDLPVGVVRVLLGDLDEYGAIRVVTAPRGRVTDQRLLKDVLNALQAL